MFKKKGKSRGQTMVELALVLPIMILVVLGLVEFGRALFIYTVISNAAREGVRAGLVDPRNTAWVEDRIRARLVLMAPDAVTVDVKYDHGSGATFTNPDEIEEGVSRILVEVSTDFTMITPVLRGLFPATTIQYVSARTIVAGARAHKPTEVP
jgi:Flp pilus assembly protein TadG